MAEHSKLKARRLVQSRLDAMSNADHLNCSKLVLEKAESMITTLGAGGQLNVVLKYNAVTKWREVDLSSLKSSLKNVQIDSILPEKNVLHPTSSYDVIMVPLYGFNSAKYRLGHGNGWYDTFLATQPNAIKVGVGFEINLVDFEVNSYDIAMDIIITENRFESLRM